MTADEHLRQCVARARPYLPDRPQLAYMSLRSDLGKHDGTKHLIPDARAMLDTLITADDGGATAAETELAIAEMLTAPTDRGE